MTRTSRRLMLPGQLKKAQSQPGNIRRPDISPIDSADRLDRQTGETTRKADLSGRLFFCA